MKSKPSSKIGLPSNSKLFLFATRISDDDPQYQNKKKIHFFLLHD
jgi:hypothetical protein